MPLLEIEATFGWENLASEQAIAGVYSTSEIPWRDRNGQQTTRFSNIYGQQELRNRGLRPVLLQAKGCNNSTLLSPDRVHNCYLVDVQTWSLSPCSVCLV